MKLKKFEIKENITLSVLSMVSLVLVIINLIMNDKDWAFFWLLMNISLSVSAIAQGVFIEVKK